MALVWTEKHLGQRVGGSIKQTGNVISAPSITLADYNDDATLIRLIREVDGACEPVGMRIGGEIVQVPVGYAAIHQGWDLKCRSTLRQGQVSPEAAFRAAAVDWLLDHPDTDIGMAYRAAVRGKAGKVRGEAEAKFLSENATDIAKAVGKGQ